MKDYQLYLEKITNALSRAGISYPAPSFSDYEGMWSYVEGLSSFLELNAQLQKAGAGVVLMGLEESTTFKSYWNSEFYQEFQERKLLESKIYSNSELSEIESDGGESEVPESAEFSPDAHENDSKTKGLATGLVVGSVVGSVIGSSLVDGVDASEPEVEGAESEEVSPLEGYNSSNVVFIDDEEDEEEVRYDEDGFVIEDEDDLEGENGSGSPVKEVSPPNLEGYDSSNIVFVDDDDDEVSDSDDASDSEYTYDEFGNKYDKDGFIVMDDDDESEGEDELEESDDLDSSSNDLDSSSNDSDDGYTYDEFGNKYDSDGFLVEDEDEEEGSTSSNGGITYEPDGSYYDEYGNYFDSDGFLIEDEEEEPESEEPQPQVEADGSYYDEYGNHFDADGFLIEDDDESEEEPQQQVEADGSYYDEYGNHFDADGFLIEDEDDLEEDSDESESEGSSSNVQPDGSYYDDFGNHYDADGFLIEDEDEDLGGFEKSVRVSAPSQHSRPVREEREEVVSPPPKPKIIMPKEVQTADKILSLFGGMESKLRKKVQDVKKPKN